MSKEAQEEKKSNKTKKRGFFSKLFFEDEGGAENKEIDNSEDISVSNSSEEPETEVSFETLDVSPTGSGVFDQNFNDALNQLIKENNIDGIDYFEFKEAVKNTSNGNPAAEAAQFNTIFLTLKVGDPSLTKDKLISSADHYISILREEEETFKAEMENKIEEEVTSRQNRAKALEDENNDILVKIQELNDKIRQNQEESVKLNGEAAVANGNINQTHKNFTATLEQVVSKLESDKSNIQTLIKE